MQKTTIPLSKTNRKRLNKVKVLVSKARDKPVHYDDVIEWFFEKTAGAIRELIEAAKLAEIEEAK